jgi:ribosome-binding factor A
MKDGEVRDLRLATLVAEELELVFYAANDQRLAELSITHVESRNGGRCFVVCVTPSDVSATFSSAEEIRRVLLRATGFLRSALAEALNLKRTPDLKFIVGFSDS